MPLYKTITVNSATKVLIWKIEESFDTLLKNIELTAKNTGRLNSMKSILHQKGFLSIRHLLALEDLQIMIYIMIPMGNLT